MDDYGANLRQFPVNRRNVGSNVKRLGLVVALLVAGCSAGTAATPEPTWTQADSDSCATADLQLLSWGDDVGATAYALYWSDLGDVTVARKQALAAAKNYVKLTAAMKTPALAAELAAVRTALGHGVTAFAQPMTDDTFKAAYGEIDHAMRAFSDQCSRVGSWVANHVAR